MRRFLILPVLLASISSMSQAQTVARPTETFDHENAVKRNLLLTDLSALEIEAEKLTQPLARALAQAEIADAAWTLDQEWAKKLLKEAYELTLPPEAEQIKLRAKPIGAPPTPPTSDVRTRGGLRRRILNIASRDKAFVDELAQSGLEKLGSYETHQRYSILAYEATQEGNREAVADYVFKALAADPTQAGTYEAINELALKDRAAADSLILRLCAFA